MQPKKRQLILGAGAAAASTLLPLSRALATTPSPPPARTLVAAYFGGWSKPIDPPQRHIHGDNPWGVYPNASYPNVQHRMGDAAFQDRYPIDGQWRSDGTGGYDEKQPEYMQAAVEYASTYGVDVFAVNWYRDEFQNYPVENLKRDNTTNTFKINNPEKIKWFLQWSNNSNFHSTPPSDSRDYFYEGIRLAALHMKDQPYYWKINNKPVFAIYSVAQIDRIINLAAGRPAGAAYSSDAEAIAAHDLFLKDCHNIVANVLAGITNGGISGTGQAVTVSQPTATFVSSMYLLVATGDVGRWARSEAVDGMYNYNIRSGNFNGVNRRANSYDEIMQAAQAQYNLYIPAMRKYLPKKISWWPALMAGYDDRPWFGSDTAAGVQQCAATPAQFQQHCSQVNSVHNANSDVTNGITFIYAWNEWGEGGWIAPSAGTGYTKLQTLKTYLKDAPAT